jgi:hypothetical protein
MGVRPEDFQVGHLIVMRRFVAVFGKLETEHRCKEIRRGMWTNA